jgi:hypothetical protein
MEQFATSRSQASGRDGATWYSNATHVSPTGAREALLPLFTRIFARIAADCAAGAPRRGTPAGGNQP